MAEEACPTCGKLDMLLLSGECLRCARAEDPEYHENARFSWEDFKHPHLMEGAPEWVRRVFGEPSK